MVIVKPGGTRSAPSTRVISATLAPLPPSRSRISREPSRSRRPTSWLDSIRRTTKGWGGSGRSHRPERRHRPEIGIPSGVVAEVSPATIAAGQQAECVARCRGPHQSARSAKLDSPPVGPSPSRSGKNDLRIRRRRLRCKHNRSATFRLPVKLLQRSLRGFCSSRTTRSSRTRSSGGSRQRGTCGRSSFGR